MSRAPLGVFAVAIAAAAIVSCSGSSSSECRQPVIDWFTAAPAAIEPGGSSLLSWSASAASTLSIDQGVGAVSGTSYAVSPASTTRYTLTATNGCGSAGLQVTVTVTPPCIAGGACALPDPCRRGAMSCATGAPTCVEAGIAVDGTACASGGVCRNGACSPACQAGQVCQPASDPCKLGVTSCPTAASDPVCSAIGNQPDGTPCGDAAVCSSGTCASRPAFVDLGTLGGSSSSVSAVNESGRVVGNSETAAGERRAFSWTEAGGMVDLGTLGDDSYALAVNDSGLVVGRSVSSDGTTHAFAWTEAGGMVDLGTLGGDFSEPWALNGLGQAVGYSTLANGDAHAFSWTEAGGMVDLGTLGGASSAAFAVSDAGQVVGESAVANGETHAFSWTEAGGMVDLGTLGGASSRAADVNELGQVVGRSETADGAMHAFSWTEGGGMVDLGTFGGTSAAFAVNGAGQVVGFSYLVGESEPYRAFSWTEAGGMIDLETPADGSSTATGVNDAGLVIGSYSEAGGLVAFAWGQASGMVALRTPLAEWSFATDVNESGQVVGDSLHAVLWNTSSMMAPGAH